MEYSMATPKRKTSKAEDEGWILASNRVALDVQGKGNKLMATIPVGSIRALKITKDDKLVPYYDPKRRGIMYEVRHKREVRP